MRDVLFILLGPEGELYPLGWSVWDRRQSSILLLWLSCSHSKRASKAHQFSHYYWARLLPLGLCRLAQSHGGETSVSPLHKGRLLSSPTLPFLKARSLQGRCVPVNYALKLP